MIKTITLRPKMNRLIANKNTYQRNEVSASFVIRKQFKDESHEGLAFIHAKDDTTLDDIHADIDRQVHSCRDGVLDRSSDSMDILNKMPRFLSRFLIWIITRLDIHGKDPMFLIGTSPYYSSVVLTAPSSCTAATTTSRTGAPTPCSSRWARSRTAPSSTRRAT